MHALTLQGPRLLLGGEGAREIAEASQCVSPQRRMDAGHRVRYPGLEAALRDMLGREPAAGHTHAGGRDGG